MLESTLASSDQAKHHETIIKAPRPIQVGPPDRDDNGRVTNATFGPQRCRPIDVCEIAHLDGFRTRIGLAGHKTSESPASRELGNGQGQECHAAILGAEL